MSAFVVAGNSLDGDGFPSPTNCCEKNVGWRQKTDSGSRQECANWTPLLSSRGDLRHEAAKVFVGSVFSSGRAAISVDPIIWQETQGLATRPETDRC